VTNSTNGSKNHFIDNNVSNVSQQTTLNSNSNDINDIIEKKLSSENPKNEKKNSLPNLLASSSEIPNNTSSPKLLKRFSSYLPSTPPLQSELDDTTDNGARGHKHVLGASTRQTWKLTDPTFPSLAEVRFDMNFFLSFFFEV
jgi:hypothetical protein